MNPALVVRLHPSGPWRSGPDTGARDEVDALYHSDTLYSAVTAAMAALGRLDAWLDATARQPERSAVSFTSCYPFLGAMDFIVPPRNIWPPAAITAKVRWKGARFVPRTEIGRLLSGGTLEEDRWKVDGLSECLVPVESSGVFRMTAHNAAAIDRLSGVAIPHSIACLEFVPGAGLWTVVSFLDHDARDTWSDPVRAAFRWLADAGFGGGRSRGWGRASEPEFQEGMLPELMVPEQPAAETAPESENAAPAPEFAYWLLSLFSPAPGDAVDWSRGSYAVVRRGGRIESPIRAGGLKKPLPMICEGSVIFAEQAPRGAAPDVAPDGFPHPVFRSGFAVSIPIPWQVSL